MGHLNHTMVGSPGRSRGICGPTEGVLGCPENDPVPGPRLLPLECISAHCKLGLGV